MSRVLSAPPEEVVAYLMFLMLDAGKRQLVWLGPNRLQKRSGCLLFPYVGCREKATCLALTERDPEEVGGWTEQAAEEVGVFAVSYVGCREKATCLAWTEWDPEEVGNCISAVSYVGCRKKATCLAGPNGLQKRSMRLRVFAVSYVGCRKKATCLVGPNGPPTRFKTKILASVISLYGPPAIQEYYYINPTLVSSAYA